MSMQRTSFVPFDQTSLENLQSRVSGSVFFPGDAGYDDARLAFNRAVDQRPALILVAANADDVAQAIGFARDHGLGIAVQSTGHGITRPADECLLIVTSRLTDVRVDAVSQTAWIGAGVKWGAVLEKAQEVGLAPLLGSSPTVGVVGYTLGGGLGWLGRKYGLATDSVRYFEMVAADGCVVRASATENGDLFWGLRGGGGSFGVITGMEIQLYPVTTVVAGNLLYPIGVAREVFVRYREWIASAPDELTSSIVIMNLPPIPQVPDFLRGKSVVMVRGCYCGPVEEGHAMVQSWLDWKAPMANMFREMPFSEARTISNDPENPGPAFISGAWLDDLSDETIDTLLRYGAPGEAPSPLTVTEVRHAGGAISRVPKDANAFGHRDKSLVLGLIAMMPSPEVGQILQAHTDEMKRALGSHLPGGVYINFLAGDEAHQRTRDAYAPETYRRLMALKARYDPDNFFRFSFDIPPVAGMPEGSN